MGSIKPDTYAKNHYQKLQNWIVAKLRFAATSAIATVAVFFYNFYTKRFAFEKSFS